MAGRVHFYDSIMRKNETTGMAEPLGGVAVTVDKILENGTIDLVTPIPYIGRKINSAATPMSTDENGEIDFWLDPGDYNISFSDPLNRIANKVIGFSSVPGAPNGMLRSQLPEYGRGLADAGDMKLSGKPADHPGWLLCDGRSLATATYGPLFDNIGYAFGGSGANFNLPDLRDRVPLGPGNMGTARGDVSIIADDTSLGKSHGQISYTFMEDWLPAHTHPITTDFSVTLAPAGAHDHNGGTGGMDANNPHFHLPHASALALGQQILHTGTPVVPGGASGNYGFPFQVDHVSSGGFTFRSIGGVGTTDINHAHAIAGVGDHTHTIASSGGGTIGENMTIGAQATEVGVLQPALAVNFFIKT